MFYDLLISQKNKPSSWDIYSMNLPCLTLVLPGVTSDSPNSSIINKAATLGVI